jgi:hypothetical protein
MAAGACFYPNASHRANRSFEGARGPGNINGLGEREPSVPAAHAPRGNAGGAGDDLEDLPY